MIADAISWLMRQLMWLYQILMLALAPVFVLCACWALLNWHDPGLVHLRGVWADITEKPQTVSDLGLEVTPSDEATP